MSSVCEDCTEAEGLWCEGNDFFSGASVCVADPSAHNSRRDSDKGVCMDVSFGSGPRRSVWDCRFNNPNGEVSLAACIIMPLLVCWCCWCRVFYRKQQRLQSEQQRRHNEPRAVAQPGVQTVGLTALGQTWLAGGAAQSATHAPSPLPMAIPVAIPVAAPVVASASVPSAGFVGHAIDTTGDGISDSIGLDTTGDGRFDTVVPMVGAGAGAAAPSAPMMKADNM